MAFYPVSVYKSQTVLSDPRFIEVHVPYHLKIICAHLGGWNYMDVHSLLVRHSNVFADLSFWPLNPRYINLVPWALLDETVPDKILLGSDYPAGQTPKEALEAVGRLPISENFRTKIIGGNAAKLLGVSA